MSNSVTIHKLQEYVSYTLPREKFSEADAQLLYEKYKKKLEIEWPSPKTAGQWQITPQGWIGYIPLNNDVQLYIAPKVELSNLFAMLEYAYNLDIEFKDDLYKSDSLNDFYSRLAGILARRVLDRSRRGIYRTYESQIDSLPYLRERWDIQNQIRAPWKVNLTCEYHEHTADIFDNQIILWTLYTIARSGLCNDKTLPFVRRAFHTLEGHVSLNSFHPNDCLRGIYNRLNQDYHPIHALCRFFLEQSGPGHKLGERTMLPFLINMEHLFELFVAQWLDKHLPKEWEIDIQERVNFDNAGVFYFLMDMVLRNVRTKGIKSVLDTKYKVPTSPSMQDIQQVIAYADTLRCDEAVLIYPQPLAIPVDFFPGRTHVRSLYFDIRTDLDTAGKILIDNLLVN